MSERHQPSTDMVIDSEDQEEIIELRPEREHQLMRLDRYVASELPDLSRTYLQQLITEGRLLVDGQMRRAAFKMTPGQVVSVTLPVTTDVDLEPQDIPLDIIFEDDDILVINKPAGMVVHPAPGHPRDTLVNAVLFHAPDISIQGSTRPGIIHRLDKDTSGVIVVAKSNRAQGSLVEQWQGRSVEKRYLALVAGVVEEDTATIDAPIGRNTVNRQQMTTSRSGRDAVSHFTVLERFADATLVDIQIETGRTHQIRVHMAFIGFPVVGDGLYGNKVSERIADELGLRRQFLHASTLTFLMPSDGAGRAFEAPIAGDLDEVLQHLRTPEVTS